MRSSEPTHKFQGAWIPRAIWLHKELSAHEKMLWGEIAALDDPQRGGCYASNEYLANMIGLSYSGVANAISKFKKLGLLIQVSFDGRIRVIKAIPPESGLLSKVKQTYSQEEGCVTQESNIGTSRGTSSEVPPISPKGDLDGFDPFWGKWPDKKNKPAAQKAWRKLKPTDQQDSTGKDWMVVV
jgi:hypothetical protein